MTDAEFKAKQDAEMAANAIPLPGPLASAFTDGPIIVPCGTKKYEVRQIVAYDWAVFQKLNLPVIQTIIELSKPEAEQKPVQTNPSDEFATAWILTRTAKEVKAFLATGKDLRSQAEDEFGMELSQADLLPLFKAVSRQLVNHCATIIKYAQAEQEGKSDNVVFFRDTADKPQMASAGG